MNNRNKNLRGYMRARKVPFWMVAERLGISDSSFSRLLRYQLSDEKKQEIMKITDDLASEGGAIT